MIELYQRTIKKSVKLEVQMYISRLWGSRFWFQNSNVHRSDGGPAVEFAKGHREWYLNGKPHRSGNKPAIMCVDGSREYWKHGKRM